MFAKRVYRAFCQNPMPQQTYPLQQIWPVILQLAKRIENVLLFVAFQVKNNCRINLAFHLFDA
jgi:hypothetical protein